MDALLKEIPLVTTLYEVQEAATPRQAIFMVVFDGKRGRDELFKTFTGIRRIVSAFSFLGDIFEFARVDASSEDTKRDLGRLFNHHMIAMVHGKVVGIGPWGIARAAEMDGEFTAPNLVRFMNSFLFQPSKFVCNYKHTPPKVDPELFMEGVEAPPSIVEYDPEVHSTVVAGYCKDFGNRDCQAMLPTLNEVSYQLYDMTDDAAVCITSDPAAFRELIPDPSPALEEDLEQGAALALHTQSGGDVEAAPIHPTSDAITVMRQVVDAVANKAKALIELYDFDQFEKALDAGQGLVVFAVGTDLTAGEQPDLRLKQELFHLLAFQNRVYQPFAILRSPSGAIRDKMPISGFPSVVHFAPDGKPTPYGDALNTHNFREWMRRVAFPVVMPFHSPKCPALLLRGRPILYLIADEPRHLESIDLFAGEASVMKNMFSFVVANATSRPELSSWGLGVESQPILAIELPLSARNLSERVTKGKERTGPGQGRGYQEVVESMKGVVKEAIRNKGQLKDDPESHGYMRQIQVLQQELVGQLGHCMRGKLWGISFNRTELAKTDVVEFLLRFEEGDIPQIDAEHRIVQLERQREGYAREAAAAEEARRADRAEEL